MSPRVPFHRWAVPALAATLLLFGGCKKQPKNPPATPGTTTGKVGHGKPTSAPTSAPAKRKAGLGKASRVALAGRVLELKNAAGYSYIKIQTSTGNHWAAVRQAAVSKGDRVQIVNGSVMRNFRSKTLKRTFATIIFGSLAKKGALGKAGKKQLASAHAKVAQGKVAFGKPLKPATGANARTVAQIYAQRKALANKPVVVRGKVTKVNMRILGKNWLHLQDGTGAKGSHDLTVTTKGVAKKGDIVTATGIVRVDKNFGAGYSYSVMLENAKLKKD